MKTVRAPSCATFIVVGNDKGGAGKTTLAANLAVGIAKSGLSVAMLDLDWRERALSRWYQRRVAASDSGAVPLVIPAHEIVRPAEFDSISLNEERDFAAMAAVLDRHDGAADVIIADTPAGGGYLSCLAHQLADIVLTPVEDSAIDRDFLTADPGEGGGASAYRRTIERARRARETSCDGGIDWIIVNNRRRRERGGQGPRGDGRLDEMASMLAGRLADGLRERPLYRDLMAAGRTAFDASTEPASLHHHAAVSERVSAREEASALINALLLEHTIQPRLQAQPALA